ncbi:MAG: HD-GYP domain-containing protein [Synergistaceae bacterium]|jgi:HD-GYP domain-containing protein (c-di-GMP phosphodiesterase class II)|nr:HD-GYP domain-containing protein [Synergistaceae bacterium]
MPVEGEFDDRPQKRRISVGELREYVESTARVAEDVLSPNGSVLLPYGTELGSLIASVDNLERDLRKWGIYSIPIIFQRVLDVHELEEILKNAGINVSTIDPELARQTVEQVENVYGRIAEGVCDPQDISRLATQGRIIAQEIAQVPQVMLCLGRVRQWDEYTYVHSLNVALLGGFLANRICPGQPEVVEALSVGGVLHDLGKARVPQEVLNKPGRLTDEEFEVMKKHAAYGEETAIENGVSDRRVLSVIRGHHERYSGNGYPDGLVKEQISLEARIAAVADVFDALTAKRVYKEPMASRAAVSLMIENMGSHFDPHVVRVLLVAIGLYPPGTAVELSDGSMGVVVGARGNDLLRPEVLLQIDRLGHKIQDLKIVDLGISDSLFVQRPIQDVGKIAF